MTNNQQSPEKKSGDGGDDLHHDLEHEILELTDELFKIFDESPLRQGTNVRTQSSTAKDDTANPSNLAWVLCIDDDIDFTWALKMRLEPHGISVVRAKEGMEGFRTAFFDPPQAILMDYEMPNGQGDYVLRRLKETAATQDIPVIMITGHRDKMLERRVMNMGATRFLTKPIDFEELLTELKCNIPQVGMSS